MTAWFIPLDNDGLHCCAQDDKLGRSLLEVVLKRFVTTALAITGGLVLLSALTLSVRAQTTTETVSGTSIPAETRTEASRGEFEVEVTPEMREHSRIRNILYFAGFLYGCVVLILILATGLSRRMRDLAVRWGKKPFASTVIFVALFSIVSAILTFPLDWYSGFAVPHQFDLSNQTFGAWLWEGLKALGIGILMGAPLIALAMVAIRESPRRWWLMLWAGTLPVTILLIVVMPLVVDPMFNKFEPLRDQKLRADLLQLASRAGIEGGRVYQVDKSKQTRTLNAYVNGIGPSKRIVMWDTLLEKMNHDEVMFVMGHEMGHYVMHHVWKLLAFTMVVLFFVFWLGKKIVDWAVARFGPRWGFSSPADPAAIPLLALVLSVMLFLLSPVFNANTRRVEHEADIFALELTRLNEAGARAFIKLAEQSKSDPEPHRLIELWRYSHPALHRRIDFALGYRPWEEGKPNEAWREGDS